MHLMLRAREEACCVGTHAAIHLHIIILSRYYALPTVSYNNVCACEISRIAFSSKGHCGPLLVHACIRGAYLLEIWFPSGNLAKIKGEKNKK